ncbi:hypothetical protein [Enterococcus sp. CSURQ0835]|uniref:hypothetical protein n=1 Tax=Enterococcus sp. CSURQ0835 TaxID=2681394 RepID=UPI00135B0671|nr:hypothetical protein [Enterococcus sp. CSURQ0835]
MGDNEYLKKARELNAEYVRKYRILQKKYSDYRGLDGPLAVEGRRLYRELANKQVALAKEYGVKLKTIK